MLLLMMMFMMAGYVTIARGVRQFKLFAEAGEEGADTVGYLCRDVNLQTPILCLLLCVLTNV